VIDAGAQVLDAQDRPIPGLYAAGNCVASPTGPAYYAGGGTLGPAVVFGWIAGRSAATAPLKEPS
jgi:succinate dehydrogenase/fumarate reductase flavoprotein subunit